jgi:prepilin-type N-terminal cleavage/methylation domain-containing protein
MKEDAGFTLVEMVVAIAIIVLFLSALVAAFNLYLKIATGNTLGAQAAYLAEEGVESVKVIRDNGWTTNIAILSTTTNYYLTFQSGTWKATTTSSMIDTTFQRTFQLDSVNRDGSSNIAASGTNDPNTRKVTVTLAWLSHGATSTQSISTYLTNINND